MDKIHGTPTVWVTIPVYSGVQVLHCKFQCWNSNIQLREDVDDETFEEEGGTPRIDAMGPKRTPRRMGSFDQMS